VKRAEFLTQLAEIESSQQVYVDEAGMDQRDDYGSGWNEKGERYEALKSGSRGGRINMIAAYCEQELQAPFTIEGACNRTVFETWLKSCLVPQRRPNQVVILDNATFHHGGRVSEMIVAAGCQLLYLPPYSPDFNRIEKCWAWLKSRIRKRLGYAPSLRDAMEAVLKDATA
jgi:transposase